MKIFEVITLFPEVFPGVLDVSIIKKARGKQWDLKVHDLREYGIGKHKVVDDTIFSGKAGMLIRPDVIEKALEKTGFEGKKIFLSPRGEKLTQKKVEELAKIEENILLLCGRYEGVDQRVIDYYNFEEISIGDYVLAGGEIAAQVIMEAIIRKIPGVLGNEESFKHETFSEGEISENRYTRPAKWITNKGEEISIPEILLSGDHKKIELFQKNERKDITNERRRNDASVSESV